MAISLAPHQRISVGRLGIAGAWSAAASLAAVAVLRSVTVSTVSVPADYEPFSWGGIVFSIGVAVGGATVVYAWVNRSAAHPVSLFRKIALAALLLSIAPIGTLIVNPDYFPGTTPTIIGVLVAMHCLVAGITVVILERQSGEPRVP